MVLRGKQVQTETYRAILTWEKRDLLKKFKIFGSAVLNLPIFDPTPGFSSIFPFNLKLAYGLMGGRWLFGGKESCIYPSR